MPASATAKSYNLGARGKYAVFQFVILTEQMHNQNKHNHYREGVALILLYVVFILTCLKLENTKKKKTI